MASLRSAFGFNLSSFVCSCFRFLLFFVSFSFGFAFLPHLFLGEALCAFYVTKKTREHLEQQHAEVIRKRRQKERQWAKARKASAKPPALPDALREKFCAA